MNRRVQRRFLPPPSEANRTSAKGFSLLEVLVALAILAIAITLVLQLFSANLRGIVRSGDISSASLKGDSRIREIVAGSDWVEESWSESTADGYRMEIAVSEVLKERTDNLPVKMMEITLRVHWIEGTREKSLSLRTMKMVDKMPANGKGPPASV